MEETRFDPKRRLCPDGGCIGVIGADGLCKVCGRPSSGIAAIPSLSANADADADAGTEPDDDGHGHAQTHAESGGFDAGRRLCDDGSCVGVVGADGVCHVCGRRAEG